jgi:hypothetical protein
VKKAERTRVGQVRVRGTQYGYVAAYFGVFADVDGGGSRRLYARRIARVGEKADLSGQGIIEAGRAADVRVSMSFIKTRTRQAGEFCKFHIKPSHQINRVNLDIERA